MPLFTVEVSGSEIGIAPGSLNITEVLKQRATCGFRVPEEAPVLAFPVGAPVYIRGEVTESFPSGMDLDDGLEDLADEAIAVDASVETRFGGTIDQSEWRVPSGTSGKMWEIRCIDWNHLADKRLAGTRTWTNTTVGQIVRDIIVQSLNGDNIDTSQVLDGPTIDSFSTAGDKYCSEEFTRLATIAASQTGSVYQWSIDFEKRFRFFSRETYSAPVVLTGDLCRANTIKIRETREGYINSIVVRFRFAGDASFSVALAQDTTEILARIAIEGGSGEYQKVITMPEPATYEEAQEFADAELAAAKAISRIITFDTDEPTYRLGQFFDVDIEGYGTILESLPTGIALDDGLEDLPDESLIQSLYDRFQNTYIARTVRTYDEKGVRLYRSIEGISGSIPDDYIEWFRGLRKDTTGVGGGESSIVSIDSVPVTY